MSITNLSLTGNQIASVIEDTFCSAVQSNTSYFGGVIGCLAVAVGVVYFGGMSALELLTKHNEQQQSTINSLQSMLEKQQERMEQMEKELAKQQQNTTLWYNTQSYNDHKMEERLRSHDKLLTKHANQMVECFDVINRHTMIADNHDEAIGNALRNLHEYKKAIIAIYKAVITHKDILEEHYETLGILTDRCDQNTEEFDKLSEQMDQSCCELEIKLEDAIDHFQSSKDTLLDRLEEQENTLASVEEELFERVETYMDKWTEGMKEMSDRVEEVDREVDALEKKVDGVESDVKTLGQDVVFLCEEMLESSEKTTQQIGTLHNMIEKVTTDVERLADEVEDLVEDSENGTVPISNEERNIVTMVLKKVEYLIITNNSRQQISYYHANLMKLKKVKKVCFVTDERNLLRFTLSHITSADTRSGGITASGTTSTITLGSIREFINEYKNSKHSEFRQLIEHFLNIGAQIYFNNEVVNFDE